MKKNDSLIRSVKRDIQDIDWYWLEFWWQRRKMLEEHVNKIGILKLITNKEY